MSENICSILSASLCTYGIDQPGGVIENVFAPEVGFIDTPVQFTAGPKNIDACYVGENAEYVILGFRGTALGDGEQQAIIDWVNNFLAKPVTVDGIPGKLHQGFSNSVDRLWEKKFQDEITARLKKSDKPLVVTGYSKGGALTPIGAAFLQKRQVVPADRMIVRMFEPPRPGNVRFARYFKKTFPSALAYAYQDDIVPHVPPVRYVSQLLARIPFLGDILEKYEDIDDWNYKSVGKLKFVDWDDKIVDGSPMLAIKRMEHMMGLIFGGDVLKMGRDHMPCGNIYNVLCGRDCPDMATFNI